MSKREIRGIIPPYYPVITQLLHNVTQAEDSYDLPFALHRTLILIEALPEKLHESLEKDEKRIRTKLKAVRIIQGAIKHSKRAKKIIRERTIVIAEEEYRPLLRKVKKLMDENGLLTLTRKAPETNIDEPIKFELPNLKPKAPKSS
jgi:hypothetical protein